MYAAVRTLGQTRIWPLAVATIGLMGGCPGQCARRAWVSRVLSRVPEGAGSFATDCPDGLARCIDGVVFASQLSVRPSPCHGPPDVCACPWEEIGSCPSRCVSEGLEVVIERSRAETQLCAPAAGSPVFVAPVRNEPPEDCGEGEHYRCVDALIVDCPSGTVAGRCLRGCIALDESIEGEDVSREAAFALLCSR